MCIDTIYILLHRSNVEANLPIENHWRTFLQIFTYVYFVKYKGHRPDLQKPDIIVYLMF